MRTRFGWLFWLSTFFGWQLQAAPTLVVGVSPMVELVGLVQMLQPQQAPFVLPSNYQQAAKKQFKPWKNHRAVQLMQQLSSLRSDYATLPGMLGVACRYASDDGWQLHTDLLPAKTDTQGLRELVVALNDFAQASGFAPWFEAQKNQLDAWAKTFEAAVQQQGYWSLGRALLADDQRSVHVWLTPLNAWGAYNVSCEVNKINASQVIVVWGFTNLSASGKNKPPHFATKGMLDQAFWHEWLHSVVNPLVQAPATTVAPAGAAEAIRQRASVYFAYDTLGALNEYLVRGTVVYLLWKHQGEAAAEKELLQQAKNGFALRPLYARLRDGLTTQVPYQQLLRDECSDLSWPE